MCKYKNGKKRKNQKTGKINISFERFYYKNDKTEPYKHTRKETLMHAWRLLPKSKFLVSFSDFLIYQLNYMWLLKINVFVKKTLF
jgi:hypothetical protein